MTIRIRSGIVLTHICDQSLLVAAYEARPYCPYVTVLNETGESIWKWLIEGKSIAEIVQSVIDQYEIPSDIDVNSMIEDYIAELHEKGYVLYEEESHHEAEEID